MEKAISCLGVYDEWNGDYDCEYPTTITCDECKFGGGRKNPMAKGNQLKEYRDEQAKKKNTD